MAGHVLKRRRLYNPARRRRRRRMTAKQIKYFGTARQRAALGNRRRRRTGIHNRRRRRHNQDYSGAAKHAIHSVERAAEDAIDAVAHEGIGAGSTIAAAAIQACMFGIVVGVITGGGGAIRA